MSWQFPLIVAASVVAFASSAPVPDDQARIQGTWVVVSAERDGAPVPPESLKAREVKMIFEANRIVAKMGEMSVTLGTFTLDSSKSPKTYDRTYPDGTPRRGIYKLDGDKLTICVSGLGKDRPSAFSTKSGDGTSLVVYRRE